jgi:hypothetical protein
MSRSSLQLARSETPRSERAVATGTPLATWPLASGNQVAHAELVAGEQADQPQPLRPRAVKSPAIDHRSPGQESSPT